MTSSGFLQLTHHMHSSKGGYEHGVAAFLLVAGLIDIFPNAMFNGDSRQQLKLPANSEKPPRRLALSR